MGLIGWPPLQDVHKQICSDGRKRGTHCCTISLLIKLVLTLEIVLGGAEA